MRYFLAALAVLPLTSFRTAPQDLLETARAAGTFETLLAALEVAELDSVLQPPATFTVFAPTDDAFASLPDGTVAALMLPENREVLTELLSSHFIPGNYSAADLLKSGGATTSSGRRVDVRLDGGTVLVGGARLLNADLSTSNGTVHVIDSVLLPQAPEPSAIATVAALAIERGAPLFNDGQEAACAAVYEVAVEAVLRLAGDDLPSSTRREVSGILQAARGEHDASQRAWALRSALDAILSPGAKGDEADSEKTLMSFDRTEPSSRWYTLNDDVMGGVSQSSFAVTENGTGMFRGAISLENNGGFASIRSPDLDLELDGYRGVRFRVRGDGRTYSLTLRAGTDGNPRRLVRGWRTDFDTIDGEWMQIEAPFGEFVRSAMGRSYPESGPPKLDAVRSLAILIADKNTEAFELEFDDFRAYR